MSQGHLLKIAYHSAIKRQHDNRLRQLDQLEASLKGAGETRRQWRQRVTAKQVEVDAIKATNAELQAQIASLRQRGAGSTDAASSGARIATLSRRASNAERKLAATQAHLSTTEDALADARDKLATAESKWTARTEHDGSLIKQLKERIRYLEEKRERERLAAREHKSEQESMIGCVAALL